MLLYQLTGKTHLHRILDNGRLTQPDRTYAVYNWLRHTHQCKQTYQKLVDCASVVDLSASPTVNTKIDDAIDACVSAVCHSKLISKHRHAATVNTLRACISAILDLMHLQYGIVPHLSGTPYDSSNALHERQVANIYHLLTHQHITPSNRYSTVWHSIGFQGTDPGTDFRSTGTFGLMQLHSFCSDYTVQARRIWQHFIAAGHLQYFSFAITGINITADVLMLLRTHQIDYLLLLYGATVSTLNLLYASMFVEFNQFWRAANPSTVMQYTVIHDKFMKDVQHRLQRHTYTMQHDILRQYAESLR